MRVFISSVRRGLEAERDSLPGLIMALGHEPVRFEDFTAQPVPSREACLKGVQGADVYLLIVGPYYGQALPETGKSPTHEEFVAAQARGIPRVVMRKEGVDLDPDQAAFLAEVEAYSTGLFRSSFASAVDLQAKVAGALREVTSMPTTLVYRPLSGPVAFQWRAQWTSVGARQMESTTVEVHVVPVDGSRWSARQIGEMAGSMASRLRSTGAVDASAALKSGQDQTSAWILVDAAQHTGLDRIRPGGFAGVRISAPGQVSAWERLPTDGLGALVDAPHLTTVCARLLRTIGALIPSDRWGSDYLVVGAALSPTTMVSVGPQSSLGLRSSASMAGWHQDGALRVEPDEEVTLAVLDRGAEEVGSHLAREIVRQLQQPGGRP